MEPPALEIRGGIHNSPVTLGTLPNNFMQQNLDKLYIQNEFIKHRPKISVSSFLDPEFRRTLQQFQRGQRHTTVNRQIRKGKGKGNSNHDAADDVTTEIDFDNGERTYTRCRSTYAHGDRALRLICRHMYLAY